MLCNIYKDVHTPLTPFVVLFSEAFVTGILGSLVFSYS